MRCLLVQCLLVLSVSTWGRGLEGYYRHPALLEYRFVREDASDGFRMAFGSSVFRVCWEFVRTCIITGILLASKLISRPFVTLLKTDVGNNFLHFLCKFPARAATLLVNGRSGTSQAVCQGRR